MCLALVLVVGSVAMLNLALRDIALDVGATQADQQWIVDAYVLVLAALLLPCGALGDRWGRRRALLLGVVIFGVANALAATADTASVLILWRAASGIGAALIMPGTLATITSVFPAEERARAVGVWAAFAGGGAILGMLGAGVLLEFFWWGSIFVVTAVLSIAAFVTTLLVAPDTSDPTHAHLDPLGTVLSAVAIGGVILGIIEGPARGWSDPLTVFGLVIGACAAVLFILWELKTTRPLLDPRLFRNRGFATGTAALMLLFLSMFGFFFLVLQFLQLQLGYSPLKSALAILPLAITMFPLSTVAAVVAERRGMRLITTLGLLIGALAFVYLATLDASSNYWHLLPGLLATGAGVALAMSPATNAIVSALPSSKQGVASAVNDTARELGAALGVAILGSAFNAGYRHDIDSVAKQLPTQLADPVRDAPATALGVAKQAGPAGRALVDAVHDGFAVGMRWALVVGAALLVLTALYTWLQAPGRKNPSDVVEPG
jgi:EmrB/QacA subfamily drug resistance transporter